MKILSVNPSYWPAFKAGGPIWAIHNLNKNLVKKGVEVTVYTTNFYLEDQKVEFFKEHNLEGVKVFYFPYRGYGNFTFSYSLWKALRDNLKDFDLVHISHIWNFPVLAAAYFAKKYKKPYIISPSGSLMFAPLTRKNPFFKRVYLFLIGTWILKNARLIHFTAEKEKREYEYFKLPLKDFVIIFNGVEKSFFETFKDNDLKEKKLIFKEKYHLPKEAEIVLFLSRLNWKKGFDTLIPAFKEIVKERPSAYLVIVGPDENHYQKKIEKLVNDYDLNDKVVFLGMLVDEDKFLAYQGADVFVLPSYSENFGMVVVEAMAASLPVVITDKVAIAEEVRETGAGLVIEKEKDQLKEAVLRILENKIFAQKLGENGRKLVREKFIIDNLADAWLAVYRKVLD